MKLSLRRRWSTERSAIGGLYVDGVWECFTLEDCDRGLHKDMQLHILESMKVDGKTAIPYGSYQVIIDLSARFKRLMPHIIGVPAFDGIRIHSGNSDVDTLGCPLVGEQWDQMNPDFLGQSVLAFNNFFPRLRTALEHEECFIEIIKEPMA